MMLINDYYQIESCASEGDEIIFRVSLIPGYAGYAGHFPNNPVAPAVCNIQMVRELAERLANDRFFIKRIDKCRLPAMITPQNTPRLHVRIKRSSPREDNSYHIHAIISDGIAVCMECVMELESMKGKGL